MTLTTMLLVAVPVLLAMVLLVEGPADQFVRRQFKYGERTVRGGGTYRRARRGWPRVRRGLSTRDGRPTGLTVEQAGEVVPEVPIDAKEMVPAAAQAWVESNAVAAFEQTPAYQATAATPAARATVGTPLAEEAPLNLEAD
jgi:hypothetical protein